MAVLPSVTLVSFIIIYLFELVVSLVSLIYKKLWDSVDSKSLKCFPAHAEFSELYNELHYSAQLWHIAICKLNDLNDILLLF